MTLLDIIQKATEAATAGLDPLAYPTLDPEWVAEAHLEPVFAALARKYASDGRTDALARKVKTLSFVSGSVTLTDDVLQSCLDQSELRDTSDYTKLYAFVPHETDARSAYDRRLGYYWAPSQGSLLVIEPGATSPALTGDRSLTASCVWDVPDDLDDDVDVSAEVLADLTLALTEVLRATLPAVQAEAA